MYCTEYQKTRPAASNFADCFRLLLDHTEKVCYYRRRGIDLYILKFRIIEFFNQGGAE